MSDGMDDTGAAELLATGITGMLLIAFVDGTLHWNERATLVETVRLLGDHVTAEQTLKFLDDTACMLENFDEFNCGDLFVPAHRLSDDKKRILLHLCARLAFSDGHLDPQEGRLLGSIADWIEMDATNREIWKREVREAMAGAEMRGLTYTGVENLAWVR